MKNRYTLGEKVNHCFYVVLKDGKPTEAMATKNVKFENDCEVYGGVFYEGEFNGGRFHGGKFHGGEFHRGEFHGGRFYGGRFHGGLFYGGEFHRGEFYGGKFHGGVFYGGVFNGGRFYGGRFHGGRFHGGVFYEGEFNGGRFTGGIFNEGEFHGGSYEEGWLPLQIRGSRHFVNIPDGKNIKIGCQKMSPEEWLASYEEIGEMEDYTDEQIKEYKRYIDIATVMIDENKQ